ncbi:hypothetical protein PybrP1_010307 [[Pythium] brassicae (nom. inval.)]|nr:hypothetical protein PybrP1_010307 [[Pythium] brassicae (nom. inval.)]
MACAGGQASRDIQRPNGVQTVSAIEYPAEIARSPQLPHQQRQTALHLATTTAVHDPNRAVSHALERSSWPHGSSARTARAAAGWRAEWTITGLALSVYCSWEVVRSAATARTEPITTANIDDGEVHGEYLGKLTMVNIGPQQWRSNTGFMLVIQHTRSWLVRIDAHEYGSLLDFMNHLCEQAARFHEVPSGRRHIVVAVSSRKIKRGEDLTVSYGDDLWFICRRGSRSCVH